MAVYRLIEGPALFDFFYDCDAGGPDRAEVIFYAPCPPSALSFLPWEGGC